MKTISKQTSRRLLAVLHYHQKPGSHPKPVIIPAGEERVELVTGGRGWVDDGGAWREACPGDLLWHVAGDSTIGRSDFAQPYRCLAVRFAAATLPQSRPRRFSRWPDLEEVLHFTREALRLFLDESADREALAGFLFNRLRIEALRTQPSSRQTSSPPALHKALQLINLNHAERMRMDALAAESGCSTPHLHYLFRRHLGKTPHQALVERRIQAARERLGMTDDPVKQIAYDCGFTHSAALCHAFKRLTGISPGRFRETMRSKLMGRR